MLPSLAYQLLHQKRQINHQLSGPRVRLLKPAMAGEILHWARTTDITRLLTARTGIYYVTSGLQQGPTAVDCKDADSIGLWE